METQTPAGVIVAGGGPVGMLLAAELGAFGISTLVLEARSAVSDDPKAGTLHARAVQGLARRGYLDDIPHRSDPEPLPFHFAGMPGLRIGVPDGEPTPILKVPQAALERAFEACARARGVKVLRSHRVTGVIQQGDQVVVVAETPDGPAEFRGSYLVGADGGGSSVARFPGFTADTRPATVSALMGAVRFGDAATAPQGWIRTSEGWVVSRCAPDGQGLVRTVRFDGAHQERQTEVTLDELRGDLRRLLGRDVAITGASSLTRFSDYTRLADDFRRQRVFLAGDAAHIHFPVGGQGLSTGLADALNLGWKLAHTVRSGYEPLLDTYSAERRPVAAAVVENTLAQLAVMRPGTEADALRALFADLLAVPDANARLAAAISAQDTAYGRPGRESDLAGRFCPNQPLRTEHGPTDLIALLRDGRPLLLLPADCATEYAAQAEAWGDVVRTVRAVDPNQPVEGAVLLRPDGYIAWAEKDGDDLSDSLRAWFGPSS